MFYLDRTETTAASAADSELPDKMQAYPSSLSAGQAGQPFVPTYGAFYPTQTQMANYSRATVAAASKDAASPYIGYTPSYPYAGKFVSALLILAHDSSYNSEQRLRRLNFVR